MLEGQLRSTTIASSPIPPYDWNTVLMLLQWIVRHSSIPKYSIFSQDQQVPSHSEIAATDGHQHGGKRGKDLCNGKITAYTAAFHLLHIFSNIHSIKHSNPQTLHPPPSKRQILISRTAPKLAQNHPPFPFWTNAIQPSLSPTILSPSTSPTRKTDSIKQAISMRIPSRPRFIFQLLSIGASEAMIYMRY